MARRENYLGLDYGSSRIGLAIADSEVRIAFAYDTIRNNKHFFDTLRGVIETEDADKVIIGRLCMAGACKESFDAEDIGEKIRNEFAIAVEYQEEMFSTKMAENNLKEKGAKKIKKLDNQEAARIILQSWLDKNYLP